MRNLTCYICGKHFQREHKTKYCSQECKEKRAYQLPIRKCKNCGKEFGSKAFHGKDNRQKFCSYLCKKQFISEHNKKIIFYCIVCNNPFEVYPSRIKYGNPKYCSGICANNIRNSNNIRFTRLKTKYWTIIRNKVIVRDNNSCIVCKSQKQLIVHHIIPWIKTRDDSENNLVTLCRSCHHKVEYYGLQLS